MSTDYQLHITQFLDNSLNFSFRSFTKFSVWNISVSSPICYAVIRNSFVYIVVNYEHYLLQMIRDLFSQYVRCSFMYHIIISVYVVNSGGIFDLWYTYIPNYATNTEDGMS